MQPAGLALRSAVKVFAAQRLRTLLAMLGVFLGALLLTAITHILGAVTVLIEEQAANLGAHVATVSAKRPLFSRERDANAPTGKDADPFSGETAEPEPAATLTRAQLEEAVRSVPQITSGVPFASMKGQLAAGRRTSTCQILGVTPEYAVLRKTPPAYGRFFSDGEEKEKALVCVLGHDLAARLFDDPALAVDKQVRLELTLVTVAGVMADKGSDSSGTNVGEFVFLPLGTAMQRFSSRDHLSGFYVGMQTRRAVPFIDKALGALLRSGRGLIAWQGDDFSLSFAGKVDEMVGSALELITMLGLIGGGISFAVGTLGVFSIMILMVHARRGEIGIRRAVGASRRLILRQFLWEAGIMAGVGGTLGVLTALSITGAVYALGLLPFYINPPLAAGVCLLSLLCGILAGGYPAWKASRVEVVGALHN